MIFLVQFGINKHLTSNCTRPTGSINFISLKKNLLVLIYSKLHSKSCDYLYKLRRKRRSSLSKIVFQDFETTFRHTFLSSELFAPWRSHKSERKDSISGNSFIASVTFRGATMLQPITLAAGIWTSHSQQVSLSRLPFFSHARVLRTQPHSPGFIDITIKHQRSSEIQTIQHSTGTLSLTE